MKAMLIVGLVIAAGACARAPRVDANAKTPECSHVCTAHDLELAGNLVVDDGAADRCICEMRPAQASAGAGSVALAGR